MAAKKDPASVVVDFFSSAPPDTVLTVLAIVKGIVARRGLPAKKKATAKVSAPTEAAAAAK